MSDDETRDVEALALLISCTEIAQDEHGDGGTLMYEPSLRLAGALLASDWLAEHDARVCAEERERIAQAIEAFAKDGDIPFGIAAGWRKGAELAARIAREGGAERAERAEAEVERLTTALAEAERKLANQATMLSQQYRRADEAETVLADLRARVGAFLWALDNNPNVTPDDAWEPIVIPAATALRALLVEDGA